MLKVGDTIKCADKEDLLNTHNDLALNGVYTDFLYEKDGEQGLWLEITKVKERYYENLHKRCDYIKP